MLTFLKWFGRLVLGLAAIAALFAAWHVVYTDSREKTLVEEEKPKPPPLAVETVAATVHEIREDIVLVGSLFPIAQNEVRARVDGYITSLPFDVGDEVEVNSELCQLNDDAAQEAVQAAEAALSVAKAQLKAKLTEQAVAKKSVERQNNLVSKGASTVQLLEGAQGTYDVATAGVELERARVEEAEAILLNAKLALDDMRLQSPIKGVVAERFVDLGDLAKPDVPVLRVVNLDTVTTTVNVIEKDYKKVALGQTAAVIVDAYPGKSFLGTVERIAPVLDPDTRTAQVQIHVKNPTKLLKPGMYARVTLNSDGVRSGLVIPLAAVLNVDQKPMTYVYDPESHAVATQVLELGIANGEYVEVLSGLKTGDLVVTLGNRLIKAGQVVQATEVPFLNRAVVMDPAVGEVTSE